MPIKLKIALMLEISFYLMLFQSGITDAQQLSHEGEGISTSTVPPSTTKKSGFFSGIRNFFRKETTTEIPFTTTATTITSSSGSNIQLSQSGATSPVQPPPPPRRDFANPNVGQNGIPISTPPTGQRFPSELYPGQSGIPNQNFNTKPFIPGSALSPPQTPPASRRDFVNPNIPQGSPTPQNRPTTVIPGFPQPQPNSNLSPINPNIPPSQSPRRDFVNSNVDPGSSPQSQYPGNSPQAQPAPTSPHPQPPRRDFVNPNIGPGTTPQLQPFPVGQSSSPQTTSSHAPSSSITPPTSPTIGQRDYVNPGIISTPKPILNNADFPPLPTPRRPSGQNQPATGTMVNFVPSQSTTQRPGNARNTAGTNNLASDEEIITLTENLFSKDVNNQHKYITVNYQGQTRSSETNDAAPNPLLQIDERALQSPTIEKMQLLFDNYELDSTVNEYVTPLERKEENDFIDAVMTTSVMRQAMIFLKDKGIVTPDPKTHRDLLKTIWFTTYSRGGGKIGSSAFEHIFVSEFKNGTVTGLHNWVYYYQEEKAGRIDYQGYIKKLDLGNKGAIAKYRFNFRGVSKPVNAMFISTSPELEMALYTLCFELRADKECAISLAGNRFIIRVYSFRYRGKNLIGSAFPEI